MKMNKEKLLNELKDWLSIYSADVKGFAIPDGVEPKDEIIKLLTKSYQTGRQSLATEIMEIQVKLNNLIGYPQCDSLHHNKKHQHSALSDCPVEAEIEQLRQQLKTKLEKEVNNQL